jgi:transposase
VRRYWSQEDTDTAFQMKRAGTMHKDIAAHLGRSVQSITSLFHDTKVLGAPGTRPKRTVITNMLRLRVMALVKDGLSRPMIAARLVISECVVDTCISSAKWDGTVVPIAGRTRRVPVVTVVDPVMTKARQLVAARLLKQRHAIDHVAEKLTRDLPGPVVLPRDVVEYVQSLAA